MKSWKKYAALFLALVLYLGLVACGGGAPDKLKTIVIDDSVEYDYSAFSGTWLGEKDTLLVFREEDQENLDEAGIERKRRMYYTLSDANDEWIAAGLLQYSEEYGYVYAHNDFNGHAYKCQFDEDNTLNISSFGAFTKVSGDVPGETVGIFDGNPELHHRAVTEFEGTWYYDNDPSAETYIIFDADGSWSYCQRVPGNAEGTEMDCGIICYSEEEVSTYYAESVMYDDMVYWVFDVDEDVLIWDDEYTYYRID